MDLPTFKLEEFWKKYEFSASYILSASETETWSVNEIVAFADEETRKLWENLRIGYTESPGLPSLRREIANLYTSVGGDQVLTFAGAEEGIYCSLRTLISNGDHVINVAPGYGSLVDLPEAFGANVTTIRLNPENNWKISLDDVEKAFRPDTKLLVLNVPHNPTGNLLDEPVYHRMIELARRSGAYIFCDEVYRFLEIDESKRLPSIVDAYEKGITLNVMTKSFGLAGLRIGWIACRDNELLNRIGSYKLYTSICNSGPSEILALIALRSKDRILRRNRQIVLKNLEILDRFFERNSSRLSWIRPESGTIGLVQLHSPIPIEKVMEDLVKETGVLILPGSVIDVPGNYFRIGFGKRDLQDVLERFEKFIKVL